MIERCSTSRWLVACAVLAAAESAGAQTPGEILRDCDVCPEMVVLSGADVRVAGRIPGRPSSSRRCATSTSDALDVELPRGFGRD